MEREREHEIERRTWAKIASSSVTISERGMKALSNTMKVKKVRMSCSRDEEWVFFWGGDGG